MKLAFAACVLALMSGIEGRKQKNINLQNKKLSKNAKASLMKKAKPYNKADGKTSERKLDEEFEITYDKSVQFSQCIHLRTENEDMCDEDYAAYAQAGTIQSIESFVIFNLCDTEDCVYEGEDQQFIVDLGSYVGALAEHPFIVKENFCQQCQENEDYCGAGDQDENDNNQDENEDEDEDEDDRRLKRQKRKFSFPTKRHLEYIDCNSCWNQGCFDEEQDGDDIQEEDVLEWIQDLAECAQIEDEDENRRKLDNAIEYNAGFTCNRYGTGAEIAVFMDDECKLLVKDVAYKNVMGNLNYQYYQMSQDALTYPFLYDIDCDGTEVEYDEWEEDEQQDNQDEEQDEEENEDEDGEDRKKRRRRRRRKLNEDKEVAEACENLYGAEMILPLDNCGEQEEQDNNNDDEDACNYYEFDISEDAAEDPAAICYLVAGYDGEWTNYYVHEDGEDDFELYDYTPVDESKISSSGGMGGAGKIVLIVLLVAAALGAGFFAFKTCGGSGSSKDSKKQRLTSSDGAMA